MSGRKIEGAFRSFVNAGNLQLEYATVLHETLLMPVLNYGTKTMK